MKKRLLQSGFILAFILMPFAAFAQYTVTGTITDQNAEPLIGVAVVVKNTTIGTISDFDGKYSLRVPQDNATLVFSYIGFLSQEMVVSSGSKTVNITLEEDVANLDEVVITGLATSVKRSNSANAVASVSSQELVGVAAASTVDAALYGKFKGVEIKANSGAPGGGIAFKLRGLTSINGSSQPLIIMDGVFINNSAIPAGLNLVSAAASGGSTSNQDNPSNRLADLVPEDIESIEVLKGASAAAIYGSRAAGGVVIMTTKKGQAGKTRVSLKQSIGQTSMLNPLGFREWTKEKIDSSERFSANIEDFNANGNTNYEDILYGNKGLLSNTNLSVSGGNDKTTFYIGANHKDEEGIVMNTGYQKTSGRLNINHKLNDIFDVSVSSTFINSSADRGFFNNDNSGSTMGVSFSSTPSFANLSADNNGIYPDNPFASSNFLQTAALVTNNESVNRMISGARFTTKLYTKSNTSLRLILEGGVDFYNLNTTALFPNSLQIYNDGAGLNGASVQGFTRNLSTNMSAFLVHNMFMDSGLSFQTTAGVQQIDEDLNTILGTATDLIGAETNLDQAGSRNVVQDRLLAQDKGFFVQEEVNFNDQILVTLGLRGDKSSNNGDANQLYYYPKANVAFNLHKFGIGGTSLSQLKVRAAYGESGNFARFGAKSTVLNSSIVNGNAGVEVPALLGNSEVAPERQKELEFGIDVGFLNRFSIDATYYIKNVEGLLLNADVPTSSGFANQVTNAADMSNKGIELGLNASIVNTADFGWNARIGWWKNEAEVTRLDVPAFTTGGFADFLGNYMIKEGFSPLTIIGVGPDPTVTLNGDGDPTLQVFGSAEPDFQLTWFNQIDFKGFEFDFLWHLKQGGDNINLSTLLFDLSETTFDFDDTGLDPEGVLANGPYRLGQLGANTGPYVEDAGYIRLREIGLYYNLPQDILTFAKIKVGFSGNNLVNIFDYNSYDPEVSNFGAGGLSSGVEVTPFPSSKRFDFHIILSSK